MLIASDRVRGCLSEASVFISLITKGTKHFTEQESIQEERSPTNEWMDMQCMSQREYYSAINKNKILEICRKINGSGKTRVKDLTENQKEKGKLFLSY